MYIFYTILLIADLIAIALNKYTFYLDTIFLLLAILFGIIVNHINKTGWDMKNTKIACVLISLEITFAVLAITIILFRNSGVIL